ncbi:hypothetical protein [Massilia sp. DD77]|uniref:hypothetical protein n=1 Tax=Massilia sp. DD77 TaxID=3109349 RepID=UPI002FFF9EA8
MLSANSVGLARIVLDGRHVAAFRYALDDARLAASLIAAGIGAKLYAGKSEGRVLDLSRQLARMRADGYLIFVSPDTLGPVCELVKELKVLRPTVSVTFWGNVEGANPVLAERAATLGQFLPAAGIEDVLQACTGEQAGVQLHSPYLSGLLAAEDVGRFGMTADQPQALTIAELEWLAANRPASGTAIVFEALRQGPADLLAIASRFGAVEGARFELHVQAAALSDEVLQALALPSVARLVVSGDIPDRIRAQAGSLQIVPAESAEDRYARASIYGKNGNIVLHTGFYFDAKQTPGIYHLELPLSMPPAARAEVYSWAGSGMDIRSAAVLRGEPGRVSEHLDKFIAPLSLETSGWPKHTYALGHASDGAASMTFDGVETTRQAMRYVAFSDLHAMNGHADETAFITMRTARDADELERHLHAFHENGAITVPSPRHNLHFENSCRWMSYGGCRLPMLRRIAVDESMKLSSCRDSGSIGEVGEDYDQIVIRVKQHQQLEEGRRECATCEVRDSCSHCTQLPSEWGGRYCEFRKRYQQSSLYLELYGFAKLCSPTFKDLPADSVALKVSFDGLPLQYYRGPVGQARSGKRPVFVNMLGQHLVWWRGTRKVLRLSEPLAVMAEGWWAGAEEADLSASLAQKFSIGADEAHAGLLQGFDKLREQGVIHA